mgnify:CR=1 FL=1
MRDYRLSVETRVHFKSRVTGPFQVRFEAIYQECAENLCYRFNEYLSTWDENPGNDGSEGNPEFMIKGMALLLPSKFGHELTHTDDETVLRVFRK